MPILTCPKCGAKNRVDERAGQMQPVCGRCGTKLDVDGSGASSTAAPSHPIAVTDASFARDVLGAGSTPVLLDCWAPWCGPCRAIAPVMDQLAAESGGRYVVGKLNVDENQRTAARFRVEGIPMLLFFKNGKLVDQIVGMAPKAAIQQKLAALT